MRLPVHDAPDLSHLFPELYARWMGEFLQRAIPAETRATCGDCAMAREPGYDRDDRPFHFNVAVKCCTNLPTLPNYLVGRILADDRAASRRGRETMLARIRAGGGVTPLGVSASAEVLAEYDARVTDFGKSEDLLCPHYVSEGGLCAIWHHRNADCASFFCKFNRGVSGLDFWRRGVKPLLRAVEATLSRWCVAQLGLPEPGAAVDAAGAQTLWGEWRGREEEFYRACALRAEALGWKEVEAICSAEIADHVRFVDAAKARLLSEQLPDPLVTAAVAIVGGGPDSTRLWAHNPLDPIELPDQVLACLHKFDGRPTAEVVRQVKEEHQLELDAALLQRLVDQGILVPATE